jgi:protein-tyrosine phosphatase
MGGGTSGTAGSDRIGVLFVCHANICRSPLAEGIFRHLAHERGVDDRFDVDSAGTWAPDGARPHELSVGVASKHGLDLAALQQRSRAIEPDDMNRFAHVLVMDRRNLADLERLRRISAFGDVEGKWPRVRLLRHVVDRDLSGRESDVPDPVSGGPEDFDETWTLLHAACTRLLDELVDA